MGGFAAKLFTLVSNRDRGKRYRRKGPSYFMNRVVNWTKVQAVPKPERKIKYVSVRNIWKDCYKLKDQTVKEERLLERNCHIEEYPISVTTTFIYIILWYDKEIWRIYALTWSSSNIIWVHINITKLWSVALNYGIQLTTFCCFVSKRAKECRLEITSM